MHNQIWGSILFQYLLSFTLISDGSLSDVYIDCAICEKKFENELDVQNHMERVHEYGESFLLYPCDQCGFRAGDVRELDQHKCEHDFAQNTELLLSEDSDAAPENTFEIPTEIRSESRKRKVTEGNQVITSKKPKLTSNFSCATCNITFTLKHNMNRHIRNKH